MTDSRSFEPSRLALARRRSGLSRSQLAERCGLKTRTIVAYEQGERPPSADALPALSVALGFPQAFFFGPPVERLQREGVSFRSLSKTAAGRREQALAAGEMGLWLNDFVEGEGRFNLPLSRVPDLHPQPTPEIAAQSLRVLWGLADKPIPNMVRLLEANGIRVLSLAENTREIDAFSFWRGDTPFVFLNTLKSQERSRFDAGHELGHLVLHRHGQAGGRQAEIEANAFASTFLMPESSIRTHAPRAPRLPDLVYSKRAWGVSVAALAHRMHKLGLISDWLYQSLAIQIQVAGYRETEPEPIARDLSQIWPLVFSALKEDGICRADLARRLSWPLDELRSLVFQLVLSADPGGGSAEDSGAAPPFRKLRLER